MPRLPGLKGFTPALALVCVLGAHAQAPGPEPTPAPTPEPVGFFHALEGHQVYLRDYAGDAKLRYRWNGTSVEAETPARVLSLSAITVDSAQWRPDGMTLTGTRRVVCEQRQDKAITLCSDPEPVLLEAHWRPTAAPSGPQLRNALFVPTVREAIDGLPEDLRNVLPVRVPFPVPHGPAEPRCDCADTNTPACDGREPLDGRTLPKLKKLKDLVMPDDLRRAHVGSVSRVLLQVAESGKVDQVWMVAPSTFAGVNVNAVKAVWDYQFEPPSCHSHPTKMMLFVDLNFAIR